MPSHYGSVMNKKKMSSVEQKIIKKNKKKKVKVFATMPKNSHKMNGTIMSGVRHTKTSKVLGKLKKKK